MRLRLLSSLALLAMLSCGRIGYEAVDDGGARDDARAGDAATDAAPGGDGSPLTDAATDGDGALLCPPECNQGCAGGICRILGDDLTQVDCPPGMPCEVSCTTTQGCKGAIRCGDATTCHIRCIGDQSCFFGADCGSGPCVIECLGYDACASTYCNDAPSCDITCSGESSCRFPLRCGTSDCSVACSGLNSCAGTINCTSACACDVTCAAQARCPGAPGFVYCPSASCETADGCTSTADGCNTCQ